MDSDQLLVIAVDHPSLRGAVQRFFDELRSEHRCSRPGATPARFPCATVIERLEASQARRLGAMLGGRLIAIAAVDDDGAVSIAVVEDHRRRGVADVLMRVVAERAQAMGHPPLRRYTTPHARLAG